MAAYLQLLNERVNERVNALLENEQHNHALKDNLKFSFDRPKDQLASDVFSVLFKPASVFKILKGHKATVWSVAFSPDSKLLVSASADNTVRLWNIPSGELNAELKGRTSYVYYSVAFSPDGKSIVTGSGDCTVRIWSIATKQVKILKGHSGCVYSVAWSPNGDVIASGSADETVILWDASSGSAKETLTGHTSSVVSVSFSQNGNKLVSAGLDNRAIIWEVDSGSDLIKLDHRDAICSVCFSPDDQFVLTGCYDGIVRMFNANNGHEEKRFDGHTNEVNSVACSFDGSMVASGSGNSPFFDLSLSFPIDNSVRLWDVALTKQLQKLDGHTETVFSVAFSRDGKFIATGSEDNTVRLWNAPLLFQIPHQPQEEEKEEESRKRHKIDHK